METCADGTVGLTKITGNTHYIPPILDKELPDVKGLDLVRHARQLSHRRRTPIIVLSATDCEREAWAAGADAFLRKPNDVTAIAATIRRLLA